MQAKVLQCRYCCCLDIVLMQPNLYACCGANTSNIVTLLLLLHDSSIVNLSISF